jgi:hypothetical protein
VFLTAGAALIKALSHITLETALYIVWGAALVCALVCLAVLNVLGRRVIDAEHDFKLDQLKQLSDNQLRILHLEEQVERLSGNAWKPIPRRRLSDLPADSAGSTHAEPEGRPDES